MKKSKQKVKEYARILYHSKKEKYQQNSIMIKETKNRKQNKDKLQEQMHNCYRIFPKKKKAKNRENGKNRYRNVSEEEKQKLKKYGKNYCDTRKMAS